jgi:tetratricopeptide (TPR) repeat protein
MYNRRFDEALAEAQKTLDMVPDYPIGTFVVRRVLISEGKLDEWVAYQRRTFKSDKADLLEALERGLEKGGLESALRATADWQAERYGQPGRRITAIDVARRYFEAGDLDLAMEWLEKAYEEHNPNLPYIGLPYYDPLRDNPRFQALLRKMNLPVELKE